MKENKKSQKEEKKDEKKKCFIIMPITTPKSLISEYSGGKDHFTHVLNQIFIPAIKKSNLEPIPPTVEGSGLIQEDIIKNLESADLVLCDMSSLNPNVFFELGIRTSLNKPVALVVDDITPKTPFDTSMIHHYTYRSALQNWTHEEDISLLSDHINKSIKKSNKENVLWKNFGLKLSARPLEEKEGIEGKVDYLTVVVESLKEKIEKRPKPLHFEEEFAGKFLGLEIFETAKKIGVKAKNFDWDNKQKMIFLSIEGEIDLEKHRRLILIAEARGWNLTIGKWGDLDGPL